MILDMIVSGYKTPWNLCETFISSLFIVRRILEIMGYTYTLDLWDDPTQPDLCFIRGFSILALVLEDTFFP